MYELDLHNLMEGSVREKLGIIPQHVTWQGGLVLSIIIMILLTYKIMTIYIILKIIFITLTSCMLQNMCNINE